MELMSHLPPAQQAVVEQGFFGGMSQRQIAATMKLPLGTVKTRMELGLRKLAHAAMPFRALIE
jgi:RNA polymerase sigma-70 factor (ECF subfamily)